LVGFGLLPATAAVASPAPAIPRVTVTCGQIITRDTKVANDLIDCPRHGLVIGAANITLDLNGHTIDGNGVIFEPCPVDEPCNAGIANSGIRDGRPINGRGFDGVTIANGTVREFAEGGIYITGTRTRSWTRSKPRPACTRVPAYTSADAPTARSTTSPRRR
jgi:hypothetical protein